jgi:hypothetical protein
LKVVKFITHLSTALIVIFTMGGCGNQSEKAKLKEEITHKEDQEISEKIQVGESEQKVEYWSNVEENIAKINIDTKEFSDISMQGGNQLKIAIEELIGKYKDSQRTLEDLDVPKDLQYQEYHQKLVNTLPRLIKSFENLLLYIPDNNEDYTNNPQLFDDAVRYVELEGSIYDKDMETLNATKGKLKEELNIKELEAT